MTSPGTRQTFPVTALGCRGANLGQARAAMSHYAFCGCHGNTLASLSPNSRRGGRRDASPGAVSGAVATGGARPRWAGIRVGVHRPAAGHPGPPAHRFDPRGPRRDLPGRVLHDRPGDRRDQAAAGRTRVRRPATTRPAPAHPGRRVRLRRGRERHTAYRRRRNPGPPAEGRAPRTGRLRLRKRKQNTIKTTTISDGQGRTLWCGRCGRAGCTTRPRCAPRASLNSSGAAHA